MQNQHKALLVSVKALHTMLWIRFCEVLNVSYSCQSPLGPRPLGATLLSCHTGMLLCFGLLRLLKSFIGSLLKFSNPAISKTGNYFFCASSGEECWQCIRRLFTTYRHVFLSVVKHDKFIIQLLEQNKTSIINNSIYAPKVTVLRFVRHLEVNRDENIVVSL